MIEKKCQGLNEKIELYLDGKRKSLPAIESIVVLNIDSWGAGVQLWRMSETEGNKTMQSYNDGKLEVVALYSSLHIAQLQVGLGVPYRVGQASHVEVGLIKIRIFCETVTSFVCKICLFTTNKLQMNGTENFHQ